MRNGSSSRILSNSNLYREGNKNGMSMGDSGFVTNAAVEKAVAAGAVTAAAIATTTTTIAKTGTM